MMAKNSEFEEEMRKSDTAAYRAGLADEPGTESTAAFMKRTGTKANRPKARLAVLRLSCKKEFEHLRDFSL
jgi:dihydroorotase-like cyclic amidohydrolase